MKALRARLKFHHAAVQRDTKLSKSIPLVFEI
jgi:hypothetical protein